MRPTLLSVLAVAVLGLASAAQADPPPPGSTWTQATITEPDGTRLHADVLRPSNLPADARTPVIVSVGPYFNHSGQTGPAGPIEDTPYDPTGTGGPVLALLRLRQRRAPDAARLQLRDGRPARVRRVVGLPGLGRAGRAVRRQGRGRVGRLAAVVQRPRGHVRQVLRRRHRADGRRPEAGRPRRGRLAGAGLRHVPLPVLQPRALLELVPHARALHRHRRDPGLDPGRPRLQPQRRGQHGAAGVLRRQLPRPAERRPRLGLLEVARPDRQGEGVDGPALHDPGLHREQHQARRRL